ncbi:hypothetical protein BGW80DRAFT_1309126 [Lactifluus volemus]|nr:hypothetical protein BGW80DRAFT_1309126 [Lactifluus volemus]
MKLFNILLILAVAIIRAFASDQYSDQCITSCIEYGAIDCYGGYVDYQCICNDFTYQSDVLICLAEYCVYTDTAYFLQALGNYCTGYK